MGNTNASTNAGRNAGAGMDPDGNAAPVPVPDRTADADPKPLPAALTERQEARRRSILDASTRLACGGGFDAVQMREVAESSGVALGTLYRYFPSKVHLLVATMEDQLGQLHRTLGTRPPAGAAASERVADVLLRAFRALQREPLLADAMFRALIFADRSVRAQVDTVSRLTTTIIVEATGRGDRDERDDPAIRVIEHTWHAALVSWLSGRAGVEQVTEDIRTACTLLDRPASA